MDPSLRWGDGKRLCLTVAPCRKQGDQLLAKLAYHGSSILSLVLLAKQAPYPSSHPGQQSEEQDEEFLGEHGEQRQQAKLLDRRHPHPGRDQTGEAIFGLFVDVRDIIGITRTAFELSRLAQRCRRLPYL